MKGIDSIAQRALELKQSGMNDKEIARELHLSENTIVWLLTKGIKSKTAPTDTPQDTKIGWTSVGVFGSRISLMSSILVDIILEEAENRDFEVQTAVGVAINGIPLATHISDELDIEFSVYRPPDKKVNSGALSSNYANVSGKNIVVVDDVIGTGETMEKAITDLKNMGAEPKLILTIVNKTQLKEIDGVPIRSVVSARTLSA
ncbi:MAG: orotate phosphoribosyltransferase-like protein [Candidatus Thermoplasmatota archaeon]|nr:orotate phosphoribosyltransferase-like protein [Euryarchaeota archaeon]MBU4032716.1 orotate phosphoribosyltransferase-like protein [Candidatus Thermoplasmatota archaeon]MBU4071297.1 orotate phosphoribosyltransferase-like protein [Candidatus Thermoplasmatota archaeon]MBU4143408.1 orotate phosphoribosyltransferase-like protein [Candidatus Thermoplasmatota archaeon]MBU4592201.1 orotate phosphoribosyltransferase-like protein [Candidatus Thermoplasmatota archaeon]